MLARLGPAWPAEKFAPKDRQEKPAHERDMALVKMARPHGEELRQGHKEGGSSGSFRLRGCLRLGMTTSSAGVTVVFLAMA